MIGTLVGILVKSVVFALQIFIYHIVPVGGTTIILILLLTGGVTLTIAFWYLIIILMCCTLLAISTISGR